MQTIRLHSSGPTMVWSFLAILWGTTWLVVRVGLEDLPPFTFAGLRFLLAAVVLIGIALVRGIPFPKSSGDWFLMTGTGLSAIGVTYAFQFWGMQHVDSGVAAVLFSAVPLITLVIAHLVLPDERLSLSKVGGVLLGIAGVALIFRDQLDSAGPFAGWAILGFLIGAVALAHSQVAIRAGGVRLDPVWLAGIQTAVGGTVLMVIGGSTEQPLSTAVWSFRAFLALGYLSLMGTVLGFTLLYWLLRRMQVTKVNSMMLVHPVVAMMLGAVVLGERLSWLVLLGTAAIVAGLVAILRPARRAPEMLITGEYTVER